MNRDSEGRQDGSAVREVTRAADAVVVTLGGELDLYNAPDVREALLASTEEQPARLIVDLGEVEFLDSTILGVLVEARSRLPNRRGFLLVAPGVETRRALEVSGLDKHFAVHESVEAALGAPL